MNQHLNLSLLAASALLLSPTLCAQQTAERLDRSPIAVKTPTGTLVSWRTLPGDVEQGISYRLTRHLADGSDLVEEIACGAATTYLDSKKSPSFTLEVLRGGQTDQTFADIQTEEPLRKIHLSRPAGGSGYTYSPNDCSVGDVDGDGEYEIIVKWDPSNSQDNSKSGKTGNTLFDCYEITGPDAGRQLWRIDLGVNVRAGAHYSPFLVYDFDGDGKAEFVVKTAPGSKDAAGNYVSAAGKTDNIRQITTNTKDYRNSNGHILSGEEFLTIFSGETGIALQTIWYWPNHGRQASNGPASYSWTGDSYGNRGHRYNACVAYLSGQDHLPSIVMQRGYYTQAYFWAVDWDGTDLTTRWLHQGTGSTSWSVTDKDNKKLSSGSGKSSYGQGVHGISVADVDGDGCDEIIMGSATIDHDGQLLCSTGFGHGDAIHVGKFIPGREGYQIYMPHEESGCKYGDDLHDAATGEILYRGYTDKDNGRGLACDYIFQFDAATGLDLYPGWEMWSGAMSSPMNAVTQQQIGKKPSTNFRVYWNGDLFEDSFDGGFNSGNNTCNPNVVCWTGTSASTTNLKNLGGNPQSCNYTKATPCLIADLYGDWREEIVCWDGDDSATLDIYTTNVTTKYPVPCLMTDHLYRLGIAWQNSSYNQPPHVGYSLSEAFLCRYDLVEGDLGENHLVVGQPFSFIIDTYNAASCKPNTALPEGLEYTYENGRLTVSGSPVKAGSAQRTFTIKGKYGHDCKAQLRLVVTEPAALESVQADAQHDVPSYDLMGRPATSESRLTLPQRSYFSR